MGLLEQETVFFTRDVRIQGTIIEKISENDKGARYILRNLQIGEQTFPSGVGILMTSPDSRRKELDDRISFTGTIRVPIGSLTFDYRTYLLLDHVYATTSVSFPEKIGVNPSSKLTTFIRDIRDRILRTIENIYPGETAKLLE